MSLRMTRPSAERYLLSSFGTDIEMTMLAVEARVRNQPIRCCGDTTKNMYQTSCNAAETLLATLSYVNYADMARHCRWLKPHADGWMALGVACTCRRANMAEVDARRI